MKKIIFVIITILVFSNMVFNQISHQNFEKRVLKDGNSIHDFSIGPGLTWAWDSEPRWLTGLDWGGQTFFGSIDYGMNFFGSMLDSSQCVNVEIRFSSTEVTLCQTYRRDLVYAAAGVGNFRGSVWDISNPAQPRRLNLCFVEYEDGTGNKPPNHLWDPDTSYRGSREYLFIMNSDYDGTGLTYNDTHAFDTDALYGWWPKLEENQTFFASDPATLRIIRTVTPLPPAIVTDTATNITRTSAILNGAVNPNGMSTTAYFKWGTSTSYGNSILATQIPISGNTSQIVNSKITGLEANTTYHFQTVGVNSGGTEYGSDMTFITLPNLPIVTTNPATNVTTTSAMFNGSVNPNGVTSTVKFEWGLTTGYGDSIVGSPSLITGNTDQTVSAFLTGLMVNTTYHYRVVATSIAGTNFGSDQMFTTYTSNYILNNSTTFPYHKNLNDYQSTDYRLIGIPGNDNKLIANFLSGNQDTEWQVYWDNGSNSADPNVYLEKYDGGSNFLCSVGRAFWLINKGDWEVNDLTVNTANLNINGEVEIPLHSGWNIITNPFSETVPWSGIQTVNSIPAPLWEYRGSQGFQQAVELECFKGYYLDNQKNLSVLKIPYYLILTNSQLLAAPDPTLWRIHVHFSQQEYQDQSVSLGVASKANLGLDNFDYRKPRALSMMPSVYFPRPEWGGQYATDIREETEEIQIWEMEVTSVLDESIRLTINGLRSVPNGQGVYLVYENEKRWINLRSDSIFTFKPVKQISKFKILVGDKDSINTQLKEILPRDFSLDQNFPNPFNPTTTIPLFLPENCKIELSVYNLLGQRVKIIYQGNIEAGKHWLHWNGRDNQNKELSAGIYIYRVTTSKGFQYSRKMIFLK